MNQFLFQQQRFIILKEGTIVWVTPWNTKNTKMLQKHNGKYDLQLGAEFEWYENPSIHRDIILDQKDLEPSGTPDYENFRYLCPENFDNWNNMNYRLYLNRDGKPVPQEMWAANKLLLNYVLSSESVV